MIAPAKRILIANRGEIACRIIRTCARLGFHSIAVASEADRGALYTTLADETHLIGGSDARDSYLNIAAVVACARAARADAVHPGYGFLSENPEFAHALAEAGIRFIGPSPAAMRALGDKLSAKAIAARTGVPALEGIALDGAALSAEQMVAAVRQFSERHPYPLLVKAAAGGGGRGMRRVASSGEIAAAIESAAREAASSFGDPRLFVEPYVHPARHVEIQLIADGSGDVRAVGDRDCSLQRKHQKVIEEAPATLDDVTRRQLRDYACRLAREADYESAGTAEFLVGAHGAAYFLEVNSRLQVEHPVTEQCSGLDLVELQIRIAFGETLRSIGVPDEPPTRGHSIEVRLCAEVPERGFAAATGTLAGFELPTADSVLRIDTGVRSGDRITHYYDSLIVKLIAHAGDRSAAIAAIRAAIAACSCAGVQTNAGYLLSLLDDAAVIANTHHLGSASEIAERFTADTPARRALAATLWLAAGAGTDAQTAIWFETASLFEGRERSGAVSLQLNGTPLELEWRTAGSDGIRTRTTQPGVEAAVEIEAQILERRPGAALLQTPRGSFRAERRNAAPWLSLLRGDLGPWWIAEPETGRRAERAGAAAESVRSPLPGKIVAISVRPGQAVAAGDLLVTIESMKMEHLIRAPAPSVVKEIIGSPGGLVRQDDVVVRFEKPSP